MRSEPGRARAEGPGDEVARCVHRARVEWSDTDAGGHHHNTVVARYAEAAEAELMRGRGLTEYFGTAPRVRYEADFTAPLWFGQEVTAIVVLERIGGSSMTFRFEVWGEEYEGRERELAASGRYVTVHVPRGAPGTRASAPWPPEWVKALREDDGGAGSDGT
jgi:acyl-CoA thioester hydrolase